MASAYKNVLTGSPSSTIDPDATAKWIRSSVAAPLLRQFDQTIMPRINDSYAQAGALMSSRRGFAGQQALKDIQSSIAQELGKAQLSNQQLRANLLEQQAQRQMAAVLQQQQMQLQYGNLASQLTGQSHMAIQPWRGQQQQQMPQMGGGGGNRGGQGGSGAGAQTGADLSGLIGRSALEGALLNQPRGQQGLTDEDYYQAFQDYWNQQDAGQQQQFSPEQPSNAGMIDALGQGGYSSNPNPIQADWDGLVAMSDEKSADFSDPNFLTFDYGSFDDGSNGWFADDSFFWE